MVDSVQFPSDTDNSTFVDIERSVHITRSDGGMFMVTVRPDEPDYPPQTFASHKAARGFAGGIRLCRRWPIVDETVEADNA